MNPEASNSLGNWILPESAQTALWILLTVICTQIYVFKKRSMKDAGENLPPPYIIFLVLGLITVFLRGVLYDLDSKSRRDSYIKDSIYNYCIENLTPETGETQQDVYNQCDCLSLALMQKISVEPQKILADKKLRAEVLRKGILNSAAECHMEINLEK